MNSTITQTVSKVAALAAGFALVASVAVAPLAHAQTTTTTSTTMTAAQVASLEAQIASLQAQLSAAQGTSSSAMMSMTFTTPLTIGSTGSQVTALQNWLISKGYSIPAGATGYFGAQTKAAVAAWQAASGISPAAGYFGPISIAKLNASGTTTTTTTTTTTGTGTTTTTGSTALSGGEGSVNNFQTVGAQSITLGTGASQQVFGFQFSAGGSDLNVSRIYYDLYNTNGVVSNGSYGTTRPWNIFQTATLTDGSGKTIATLDATNQNNYSQDGTATDGNQIYRLDFENVNEVVKMNATQQYYLTLTTDSAFSTGNAPAQYAIGLAAQGLRATDAMGLQEYSSSNFTYSLVNVNLNSSGSLTLSTGSNNPQTTTVMANQNTSTQGVVLNAFTIQNTGQSSVELYTLPVTVTTTNPGGTNVVSNVVQDLKLYQGTTLLDTESPSATSGTANYIAGGTGTLNFKNINLTIPSGTTDSFTVEADIQPVNGVNVTTNPAYSGASVTVTVPGTGTDIETTGGSLVPPSGASTGYPISFAVNGLSVASAPTTASATAALTSSNAGSQQTGTFTFVFNVTAFGQTIYVASTSNAYSLTIQNQTTGIATSTTNITSGLTSSANLSPDGNFQINSGQTATFTVSATLSHGGSNNYYYAILKTLNYGTTDLTPSGSSVTLPSNYTTNAVAISS